ncbi:MAG TPA: histidine phosphatase family protein, partial [Rubrobacteraceae bacterium]|nr:histidine phosphatase family protein [Rubrobacteraceae bacterium]
TSPSGAGQRQEMILIRHAQSTANATGIWQGQLDFPLSEQGRLQAAAAGRALAGTRISAIYSSPLSRAFETAEIVAREAGFQGEIVAIPDLMERHGGILEGHTWAEQEARNPAFAKKFLDLPEEERWTLVDAETDEEILARFERAISAILSRHHSADGSFVVVSHGGVMRAFLRDRFGPTILPGAERAPNASITRLLWDLSETNAAPRLLELASTRHLPEERRTQAGLE